MEEKVKIANCIKKKKTNLGKKGTNRIKRIMIEFAYPLDAKHGSGLKTWRRVEARSDTSPNASRSRGNGFLTPVARASTLTNSRSFRRTMRRFRWLCHELMITKPKPQTQTSFLIQNFSVHVLLTVLDIYGTQFIVHKGMGSKCNDTHHNYSVFSSVKILDKGYYFF